MHDRHENVHKKRINEVFIENSILYSCSNDGSVRLFDIKSNKIIKRF